MYKLLAILFFMICVNCDLVAQEELKYILSKEQHDALQKNIQDYRNLIKKFDQQNQEFEALKREFALTKALKNNDEMFELEKLKTELLKEQTINNNQKIQYENLKVNYDDLQQKILVLNKQLEYTARQSERWRSKYSKQIKYDRGDRIMEGAVFGSMVGAALMAIYMAIENH